MKTLLITALTTALLSFNSFADNTTDIKNMASLMAKEGQQQLNTQLILNSKTKALEYFKTFAATTNSNITALVANVTNKNSAHAKNTTQATD